VTENETPVENIENNENDSEPTIVKPENDPYLENNNPNIDNERTEILQEV